jgi:hypothetical protein
MIIKNDRKNRWGNDFSEFNLDNNTIKVLRHIAKKQGSHFLKYIRRFLKEVYTIQDHNYFLIIDFGFGFSVFNGQDHNSYFYDGTFDQDSKKYLPEQYGYCDFKDVLPSAKLNITYR